MHPCQACRTGVRRSFSRKSYVSSAGTNLPTPNPLLLDEPANDVLLFLEFTLFPSILFCIFYEIFFFFLIETNWNNLEFVKY